VHYLTVYIPPNDVSVANEYLRTLKWIILRIKTLESNPNIVLVGDFNKIAIGKVDFLESFGLVRVVKQGVATHLKGSTLDEV
jgi:hypothetical protein